MQQEFIRLKLVSKLVGLSTATLRKYIKEEKLKAIKVGGNYCITMKSYEEFILNLYLLDKGFKVDELDKAKDHLLNEQRLEQEKMFNELLKSLGMNDTNIDVINNVQKTFN